MKRHPIEQTPNPEHYRSSKGQKQQKTSIETLWLSFSQMLNDISRIENILE